MKSNNNMKHMKPHEALHCEPCEIYDDAISRIGFDVVDSIKLERLLNRRGQLPEEYFIDDESSPSIIDLVRKHYGDEAIKALSINFNGLDYANLDSVCDLEQQ